MDFNVNVNVKFDATPALTGVVSTLAGVIKPVQVMQPVSATSNIPDQAVEVKASVIEQPVEIVSTAPSTQEQPQAVAAVPAVSEQPGQDPTGEITDEMLRKLVGPVTKSKGKEAVFKILDDFGVKRVPDLKPEQRQAFITKLKEL